MTVMFFELYLHLKNVMFKPCILLIEILVYVEGLCTLLYDAYSFLPYCMSVCSLTPWVGTAGIMKIWPFKIYLFRDK